jgi:glycosyltransferase involved in cell wall biosynthesis
VPLIALDARLTRQMSIGMKAYVRELVARMPLQAPDLEFVVYSNAALPHDSSNTNLVTVTEFAATNGALGEQLVFPRQLNMQRPDLIHYMSVYAPRFSPAAHVYTIHDLIHLRFPAYFSWKVPLYYRYVAGPVARSARAVITDAAATVSDLHDFLSVAPERTRVIPLGVSEKLLLDDNARAERAARVRGRFGIERPYFLYAGNHRPHKNLHVLYAAWHDFVKQPCDLVVTEEGPLEPSARRRDAQWADKSNGKLYMTGHVNFDDLITLYAGSVASIQPSLYEGFGLSVLEAMASGTPAIVAQTPALLEVGGDAVASFPPTDAAKLATIMDVMLTDTAEVSRLGAAGRKRVATFTWDATARATAQVYREVLKG